MSELKTYRLASGEFVYAPGIVRWAIHGAKLLKSDREKVTNLIASTWGLPGEAALALVTEKVPYSVEDDTVVFSA
jgi:hypothetical protein